MIPHYSQPSQLAISPDYVVFSQIIHNARVREGHVVAQDWLAKNALQGEYSLDKDQSIALSLYILARDYLFSMGVIAFNQKEEKIEYDQTWVNSLIGRKKILAHEFNKAEVDVLMQKISDLEKITLAQ